MSLLRQQGITLKRELKKKGLSEEKISEEFDKWLKLKEAKTKSKPKRKKKSETVPGEKPAEETKESTAEVTGAASEEIAPQ
jgi:hypothetical protein